MKKSLILTAAAAITLAGIGFPTYAQNTIEKGQLGSYVREGRFVKPVITASPRGESGTESISVQTGPQADVDKGALGKYERHGRVLRAIRVIEPANRADLSVAAKSPTVTHDHGLNNKEHKNISN